MSVFDWLKNIAGGNSTSVAPKPVRGGVAVADKAHTKAGLSSAFDSVPDVSEQEKAAMDVGGLNFLDAIAAHQKWKSRLTSYLAGTSSEKLDYLAVCRDDQCVLGKWINGSGGIAYGNFPIFSQLKMTHAQFHLAAGNIIQLQDEGKADQALEALKHGNYSQHSIKVQGLISSLYMEVKSKAGK